MSALTITEALAEVKTIAKRIEKKREFIGSYMARPAVMRDPLQDDGGGVAKVAAERQAIADLQSRVVLIRTGIQKANQETSVTIESITQTIAQWLTWRKEVAPGNQAFLARMRNTLDELRKKAAKNGGKITDTPTNETSDWIINVNESDLAAEIETLETILGTLDGVLSLKNATTFIELP